MGLRRREAPGSLRGKGRSEGRSGGVKRLTERLTRSCHMRGLKEATTTRVHNKLSGHLCKRTARCPDPTEVREPARTDEGTRGLDTNTEWTDGG